MPAMVKTTYSKAELAAMPAMPKRGTASHYLGAKIYLSKGCFRIILFPPNYASERKLYFEKPNKPSVRDLKAVKAVIVEAKVK